MNGGKRVERGIWWNVVTVPTALLQQFLDHLPEKTADNDDCYICLPQVFVRPSSIHPPSICSSFNPAVPTSCCLLEEALEDV